MKKSNVKLAGVSLAFILLLSSGLNVNDIHINKVSALTTIYTTISDINLRTGPSFSDKVVVVAKKGTEVSWIANATNGWVKVSLNGKTGYVNSIYLVTSNVNPEPPASQTQMKTHVVKKGEGLYGISKLYGVTVADIKTWNKLSSDNLTIGQILLIASPNKGEAEKPVAPTTPAITTTYTTTTDVNIRTSPTTSSKVITTVKKGTKLSVSGKVTNGWYKVSLNGKTGYVSSQHVMESTTVSNNIPVVAQPESISVLVNKNNMLPKNYVPKDLVYTSVPFTSNEISEKRKMRKEASNAISKLFTDAKKGGIHLRGVSAYRSNATQTALFNSYVKRDGYAKATTYSAIPGTSEHETGLAIDVVGADGRCAVQDCFANTKEAKWLAQNASNYGFIIRYPKGKEHITGYKYEPWHLRYVGVAIAKKITSQGITLEEYYNTQSVQK